MKTLAIIPARAGSKRMPGKNFKLLNGKPLISYAIENAIKCSCFERIVITTDSEECVKIGEGFEGIDVIRRPKEISQDNSLAIEYVKHSLQYCNECFNENYDSFCIIQPTSPLIIQEDIIGSYNLFKESGLDSVVSITEVDFMYHPAKFKIISFGKLISYFEEESTMSYQQLPKVYVRNGAIYISKTQLISKGLILSRDCAGYFVPRERSVDINNFIDFEFAEFILMRRHNG